MGYLDKQSRVVDVVLTERGRKLYSVGRLDFAYFGLFDDLIDYDPMRSSGSFSHDEREEQIEATLILEAPYIPDIRGTVAPLEPHDHIFSASPGYVEIPTMKLPIDDSVIDLMSDQRREDGVYRRTGTSLAHVDLDVVGDIEQGNPGFIVRVLSSGSNGLQPLQFRRDLLARRVVDPFIAISIDDEGTEGLVSIGRPDSIRVEDEVKKR